MWQSSQPASFSPAGLTLWPSWLERWLATLSGLSVQDRIQVELSVPGYYIRGSSAGLGKAQHIESSLRADWLSCFSLAWWGWRVARQGCLVPLRKGGMWQSSRPASFSPAALTLWPSWLERWLTTLSGLSVQVRIQVELSVSGHYTRMESALILFPVCQNIKLMFLYQDIKIPWYIHTPDIPLQNCISHYCLACLTRWPFLCFWITGGFVPGNVTKFGPFHFRSTSFAKFGAVLEWMRGLPEGPQSYSLDLETY